MKLFETFCGENCEVEYQLEQFPNFVVKCGVPLHVLSYIDDPIPGCVVISEKTIRFHIDDAPCVDEYIEAYL